MESVITSFQERVGEIEEYLALLQLISRPNTKVHSEGRKPKQVDTVVLKTMKASCFLMLYNLVESSIKSSMEKLYEKMNSEERALLEFNSYVKNIWINQKFRDMDPFSSNQTSYRNLIQSMVDDILVENSVYLDSRKLHIGGNLDADEIRLLFDKHKISTTTHYRAFGGGELKTIKDKRNLLAHGAISFADCGQEYSVKDIIGIKKQAVVYLRSSLRNVKKYMEQTKYAA